MGHFINKMLRKKAINPKLKNLNEEYIKRLLLSMTTYCDAMHVKGWVPYATYDSKIADCSLFDIKRKIEVFLSDPPEGYLMLTGPEVIGLTFGPEAQEQYEQILEQHENEDGEAGHGVGEDDEDGYAGHGVGPEEPEEQILTSMEDVDGGKRRTKRRRSMKRKIRSRKNKKSNKKGKRKSISKKRINQRRISRT
jgi:hypothetical protein